MNHSELVKKQKNLEKQKIRKDNQSGLQFLHHKIFLVLNIAIVSLISLTENYFYLTWNM